MLYGYGGRAIPQEEFARIMREGTRGLDGNESRRLLRQNVICALPAPRTWDPDRLMFALRKYGPLAMFGYWISGSSRSILHTYVVRGCKREGDVVTVYFLDPWNYQRYFWNSFDRFCMPGMFGNLRVQVPYPT